MVVLIPKEDDNLKQDLFAFGTMMPASPPDFAKEYCPKKNYDSIYTFISAFLRGYVYSETLGYSTCYEVSLFLNLLT